MSWWDWMTGFLDEDATNELQPPPRPTPPKNLDKKPWYAERKDGTRSYMLQRGNYETVILLDAPRLTFARICRSAFSKYGGWRDVAKDRAGITRREKA